MVRFASKYVLAIRTCSEESTVLPVHETYFLISLWEPNELQNICKVQSVNYAFMYMEEMSHDWGSHWTWSIVSFYPLLSLKASLNSPLRQRHCQRGRWISLATHRSRLSAQKVSPASDSSDILFAYPASLVLLNICFKICASRSSLVKTEHKAQTPARIWKSNHASEWVSQVSLRPDLHFVVSFLLQLTSNKLLKKCQLRRSILQEHIKLSHASFKDRRSCQTRRMVLKGPYV